MNKEALATRFLKSRGRKVKDVMTAKNLITAKPSTPLRAFPGGIESGGFPTAFAQAKLEKLIRLGARSMPKPYSTDLRERAVEAVESGASRRGGAGGFEGGGRCVFRG